MSKDDRERPRDGAWSADQRGLGRPTKGPPASSCFLLSPRSTSRRVERLWTPNPKQRALDTNEFDDLSL